MTSALNTDHLDNFPPPSQPPPLLSDFQLITLAHQGHLPLPLRPSLADLYTKLSRAASQFFSLPSSVKHGIYSSDGTEVGYVSIPGEKDYISFRSLTAHADSELETLAAAVWQETFTLLYRILGDLSYAMGIGHEVWDKVVDGVSQMPRNLEDATPTLLRLFRYEPNLGFAEQHIDMGLLTLCVCEGKGLQVLVKDEDGADRWIEYQEPILLVGEILRILSGSRVKAGVHRVVGTPEGRGSIVFALRPSTNHEIDMGIFPDGVGMIHMDTLWKKVSKMGYNINAPKDVRERQKKKLGLRKGKSVDLDQQQFGA
jgi:isopenicillin N synthase-like dioxygenase